MRLKASAVVFTVALLGLIGLNSLDTSPDFSPESDINSFESEEEFKSYLEVSGAEQVSYTEDSAESFEREVAEDTGEVDVVEPETVVEDGESIYYGSRYPQHLHVVDTDLSLEFNESGIGGQILQTEDLIVTVNNNVTGYSKQSLEEEWSLELDSRLETVRKTEDTLTVVTRESIDYSSPCPVRPAVDVEIGCSGIIYPSNPGQVDYTYNILKVDVGTGDVEEKKAFTGSRSTTVEVTPESIYVSYTERTPESEIMTDTLLSSNTPDQELKDRVEEIQSYELTERSRKTEIEEAVERFSERGSMEDLEREVESYDKENMRGYSSSQLLKFNQDLERESLGFEGEVTGIESVGDSVVVTSRIRGLSYSNSEYDIHRLEGFEVQASETGLESSFRDIQEFGNGLLVRTGDGLEALDQDLETVESYGNTVQDFKVHGDRIITLERETRTVETEELETSFRLLDSEFNTEDSVDAGRFYRLGPVTESEDSLFIPVQGGNSSILEVSNGRLDRTEVEGYPSQVLSIGDRLYLIERNRIVMKDLDLNRLESIDLHTERNYGIRPVPEPR